MTVTCNNAFPLEPGAGNCQSGKTRTALVQPRNNSTAKVAGMVPCAASTCMITSICPPSTCTCRIIINMKAS